jgi:dCTP deaminase
MAILARNALLKAIKSGRVKIKPFNQDQVGPGSIDFHLDKIFRVFLPTKDIFHIKADKIDYQKVTKVITVDDHLTLLPGQSAQGITIETLALPNNLCGWIQGRSTLARVGLMVHITANFIHPGTSAKQVLEMTNAGPIPLAIHPGISICQIILEETKGQAQYQGKFSNQQAP